MNGYYTCRVNITNRDKVRLEKLSGPNGVSIGERYGDFRYKERATQIQELCRTVRKTKSGKLQESVPQELGELLYESLFDEKLQRELYCLLLNIKEEKASLRIELEVDEQRLPDVAALPWEFLRVPSDPFFGGDLWMGTDPSLRFLRRRARSYMVHPIELAEHERLRIVVVVAEPKDLGPVVYKSVWNALQDLANKQPDRIEQLLLVHDATTAKIDDVLELAPHILHFMGHARLQNEQQQDTGQIALVNDITREASWVDAKQLKNLFRRHQPHVVLLHACESASLSESDAFVGVASQIVQQDVPVVVAMQYEVTNAAAQRFALEFYERLLKGEPVDKAVQEGRWSIARSDDFGYKTRDFATPVLFMRV